MNNSSCGCHRKSKSELGFNADTDVRVAVAVVSICCVDIRDQNSAILCLVVNEGHSSSNSMPWPASAKFLQSKAVPPPSAVIDFLSLVIAGKSAAESTVEKQMLTMSVVEDICSASTQGMWLMPKHIVLGTTVRHLSGRADLITILNRYGHYHSYAKLMEIDTALADQVVDSGSLLPSNISVSANVLSMLGQL